jgi:hypothetical protein
MNLCKLSTQTKNNKKKFLRIEKFSETSICLEEVMPARKTEKEPSMRCSTKFKNLQICLPPLPFDWTFMDV